MASRATFISRHCDQVISFTWTSNTPPKLPPPPLSLSLFLSLLLMMNEQLSHNISQAHGLIICVYELSAFIVNQGLISFNPVRHLKWDPFITLLPWNTEKCLFVLFLYSNLYSFAYQLPLPLLFINLKGKPYVLGISDAYIRTRSERRYSFQLSIATSWRRRVILECGHCCLWLDKWCVTRFPNSTSCSTICITWQQHPFNVLDECSIRAPPPHTHTPSFSLRHS